MGASPRVRIAAECDRRSRDEVVRGCVAILRGDDPDPSLLFALGGPAAMRVLTGATRADERAWSRVWAARGLLWALDGGTTTAAAATAAVVALGARPRSTRPPRRWSGR